MHTSNKTGNAWFKYFYFSSLKERFVRKQIRHDFSIMMTLYEYKGNFPFKHEVSLVVCLMLICRPVDVATFWSRYLKYSLFYLVSWSSVLYGNQQGSSSFLLVKSEMYWCNISGSPFFPLWSSLTRQSPEQTRLFLNHRASHSYNMYIYSTCIEK